MVSKDLGGGFRGLFQSTVMVFTYRLRKTTKELLSGWSQYQWRYWLLQDDAMNTLFQVQSSSVSG